MRLARILLETALVVCLSALTMYVTSCAPAEHEPLVAEGLLTGEPCEPPCWQGLTPGVSTEEEVNEFLRSSQLVDQSSIFRGEVTRGRGEVVGTTIQWWSTANMSTLPRQLGNDSVIMDGVLQYVTIWLDSEVTLHGLLERYGAPDKCTAWMEPVDPPHVRVTLFYPRHGFEATLIIPQDDVQLRPGSEIVTVWYFRSASQMEGYLRLCREIGYPCASEDTLQNWQGYGAIDLLP